MAMHPDDKLMMDATMRRIYRSIEDNMYRLTIARTKRARETWYRMIRYHTVELENITTKLNERTKSRE